MATQQVRPVSPLGAFEEAAPEHLTRDDRVALLRYMLLMRSIEERAMNLYRQGKVPGSFYDGFGQEAVSAGAAFAMAAEDRLCILHRDLGAHLVRGVDPARTLGQYMGRAGGFTAGRDGNVHFGDRTLGCVGMVSMLPDMMLVATGMAMAFKLRGERRVRSDLVRRRLDLARRLPRGDELGGRTAAARDLRAGEQPVRLLDAARPAVRRGPGRARRGVRLPRAVGRRQRRRGGVRGHPGGTRARARRRRADADRGRDDAHARPRRARRHDATCPRSMVEEWARKDPIERQERAARASSGSTSRRCAAEVRETDRRRRTEEALAMPMPDPATRDRRRVRRRGGTAADDGRAPWSGFAGSNGSAERRAA